MKTKLLRKIRKRFDWYINRAGFPVLIDHRNQTATNINLEYLMMYYKYSREDVNKLVEIPLEEWAFRNMIHQMVKSFGLTFNNILYKVACRRVKIKNRQKHFNNETEKT